MATQILTRQKPGHTLEVVRFGATETAGTVYSIDVAPTKDATTYEKLGRCEELSVGREDGETIEAFDYETLNWEKDEDGAKIVKKGTLTEYSGPILQLLYGTDAPLVATQSTQPYTNLKPLKVWLKDTKYSAEGVELSTEIIPVKLELDGDQTENSKIAKPKVKMTVMYSAASTLTPTAAIANPATT